MEEEKVFSSEIFANSIVSNLGKESLENKQEVYNAVIKALKNCNVTVSPSIEQYPEADSFNKTVLDSFVNAKLIEGKSEKTMSLYKTYIQDLLSHIDKPLDKITTIDIRNYLLEVKARTNNCNRTLDGRRACLQSFFSWCSEERVTEINPVANVRPIKYERIPKEPLNDTEMVMIKEACRDVRDRALVEFLYSTGVRVSEIVNIKIADVNFDRNEIVVLGKGNKHRKVYLSDSAKYYLQKYLATRKDKSPELFVCLRAPHKVITKPGIEKRIRELGVLAKLNKPLTPHLFRHTCATNLLRKGMKMNEIQAILGHENITTTMVYAKNNDEDIKNHHYNLI